MEKAKRIGLELFFGGVLCILSFGFGEKIGIAYYKETQQVLNSKYGKVEDITALQGTWNEFKLDLVDTVRKSDRTDDEKVKIINEIMSIPTQLPTEAPK